MLWRAFILRSGWTCNLQQLSWKKDCAWTNCSSHWCCRDDAKDQVISFSCFACLPHLTVLVPKRRSPASECPPFNWVLPPFQTTLAMESEMQAKVMHTTSPLFDQKGSPWSAATSLVLMTKCSHGMPKLLLLAGCFLVIHGHINNREIFATAWLLHSWGPSYY